MKTTPDISFRSTQLYGLCIVNEQTKLHCDNSTFDISIELACEGQSRRSGHVRRTSAGSVHANAGVFSEPSEIRLELLNCNNVVHNSLYTDPEITDVEGP